MGNSQKDMASRSHGEYLGESLKVKADGLAHQRPDKLAQLGDQSEGLLMLIMVMRDLQDHGSHS